MRNIALASFVTYVLSAAPLFAQSAVPPPPPVSYPITDAAAPNGPPLRLVNPDEKFHIWTRFEVLAWWVKDTPLPAPIVTATDAGGNTQTVVGGHSAGFGAFAGIRFGLGAWFDEHNNYGFETIFFSLERRHNNQGVFSDGNGNPSIGLSYASATPGQTGEFIQPLSTAGTFAGNVLVSSTLTMWGAEINGVICAVRVGGLELTGLAGFRYVHLNENLYISSASSDIASGDFIVLNDQFSTHNDFYGGQIGARVNWHGQRWSLDATGKLALGGTQQAVNIQGDSFSSASGAFPGGFYAQPSNIGHYSAAQFGIIPSLELKLSYEFTPAWRLFIGYDFMYWNQVVRPGNQLDRNVNLTQSALLGNGRLERSRVARGTAKPQRFLGARNNVWLGTTVLRKRGVASRERKRLVLI